MLLSRWKSPQLACAVVFTFPLFGCATHQPVVSSQMISVMPVADHRMLSASYQQALDQRIRAQPIFGQLSPDLHPVQPTVIQTASGGQVSAPPVSGKPVRDQSTFGLRILTAHNQERLDLGLGPLSWNQALAQAAQRWAEHLAETGRFEHAPEDHRAPQGENLWAGTRGYYTPEAMVNAWIREKRYFRSGVFPDNSTTGRVEDIGHYTQVIWRATHEVGCAEAASASEDILVCRYAEAGNYRGERPF